MRCVVFSQYNGSALIIPPDKISKSYYKCDKYFHLDTVMAMYQEISKNYGIILLSGREYRIYLAKISKSNKEFKLLKSDEQRLQNKHRRGGQSSVRFEHIRVEKRNIYTKQIAELVVKTFMVNNNTECTVEGLVIAGPADIKKEVMEQDIFHQYFSKNIIKIMTCDVIDDTTIYKVYDEANLSTYSEKDKKILDELSDLINKASDRLVFGLDVWNALEENLIEKLIISDQFDQLDAIKRDALCKIFTVSDHKIKMFGQVIGIKYY